MPRLWQRLGVFTTVGAVATLAQYAMLVLLVETFSVSPVAGSSAGFVASSGLNYWLNHRYTFDGTARHVRAVPRFACVSLTGLLVNGIVMFVAHSLLGIHYLASQVAATFAVFVWNFVGHSAWSFRQP
jgi:putative flippase GtrA